MHFAILRFLLRQGSCQVRVARPLSQSNAPTERYTNRARPVFKPDPARGTFVERTA